MMMDKKALDRANIFYLAWVEAIRSNDFFLAKLCEEKWQKGMNQVFISKNRTSV